MNCAKGEKKQLTKLTKRRMMEYCDVQDIQNDINAAFYFLT